MKKPAEVFELVCRKVFGKQGDDDSWKADAAASLGLGRDAIRGWLRLHTALTPSHGVFLDLLRVIKEKRNALESAERTLQTWLLDNGVTSWNRRPLSEHAITELGSLSCGPLPTSTVNPGVVRRLTLDGLAAIEERRSPFKTHRGRNVSHLVITPEGIAALAEYRERKP